MKYEIMFIVRPDMEAEAQKELLKTFDSLLKDNGAKVETFRELGQKELAYEIKNHKSGFYFLYEISSKDSKAQKEFDRIANLSEDVIRHMIINTSK
ncbi:MAG: 30S ribosomal protein S6 [Bacilli bacterium]|jgi:small subunit ribosomal protein S6|nr:30S ribosomal protein S6 [Bacilli bacterium]MDD3995195.1 30S ribosomal protein S6 [Bacilli bacterium]MDD4623975.1 30S ribosomal protein S6 [Bacilli bacterium]MDD4831350.1 30S ribosomal protein S6 [Bacilli bacterium]